MNSFSDGFLRRHIGFCDQIFPRFFFSAKAMLPIEQDLTAPVGGFETDGKKVGHERREAARARRGFHCKLSAWPAIPAAEKNVPIFFQKYGQDRWF
jgi:hypothetical protein